MHGSTPLVHTFLFCLSGAVLPSGGKPSSQQQAAPGNHAYKPTGSVTSTKDSSADGQSGASVSSSSSSPSSDSGRTVESSGASHAHKPSGSATSARSSSAGAPAEPLKASAASAAASSATKPVQGSPGQPTSSGTPAKGPKQDISGPAGQGYPPSTSGSVTAAAASPKGQHIGDTSFPCHWSYSIPIVTCQTNWQAIVAGNLQIPAFLLLSLCSNSKTPVLQQFKTKSKKQNIKSNFPDLCRW